MITGENG